MTNETKYSVSDVFTTISLFGDVANWPYFLHVNPPPGGEIEKAVNDFAVMVFWKERGRVPESMDEVNADEGVQAAINTMKTNMRAFISSAFSSDEASSRTSQWQRELNAARERELNMIHAGITIKERMKPAQEGTVSELAERYGKSKSEIRRLKREGLLHTLEENVSS